MKWTLRELVCKAIGHRTWMVSSRHPMGGGYQMRCAEVVLHCRRCLGEFRLTGEEAETYYRRWNAAHRPKTTTERRAA